MSARPIRLSQVDEVPRQIDSGRAGTVQTLFVQNDSEATGYYVKLYMSETAPTAASVPVWSDRVPAGAASSGGNSRTFPVFAEGAQWWIAVAALAGAGLTAHADEFEISLTFERATP